MSKRNIHIEGVDQGKMMRRLNWERSVAEMRDGRRDRATTIPDGRKKASRNACRKNRRGEWA